jgi:aryl sulfotransferase
MPLPEKSRDYLGNITDTRRWDHFEHRPDDIFVCTPPKCGTTWTQAICASLVFETADHGQQPGVISPWFDAQIFVPLEMDVERIAAQTHRRFLKTHTPLDGIPYFPECTYLVVLRDPRDVFFSGLNHRDNMNDQEIAMGSFPSGPNAFYDWLEREPGPGSWDLISLHAVTHFLESYWPHRHLPNIHMHHYSDMKRDLKGEITKMAVELGVSVDDDQLQSYAEAATFDSMKSKADQFAPGAGMGVWKAETDFFASGKSEQWQDKLSEAELAAFAKRLAELLPPDAAEWLLNGSGPS